MKPGLYSPSLITGLMPMKIYLPNVICSNSGRDPFNGATPASSMMSLLNALPPGSSFIFPREKTYTLESHVYITNINNVLIDFNGCTLRLPNNCSFLPDYDRNAIHFHNCSGSIANNLKIDGNKENNSLNDCIGLAITNSPNMTFNNLYARGCPHHAISIGSGTPGLIFNHTLTEDTYGFSRSADIYVENSITDDVTFFDTKSTRDAFLNEQCFYINGYNVNIDTLVARGHPSYVLDVRKGTHTFSNIYAYDCGGIVIAQGGQSNITCTNLFGSNVRGGNGRSAMIYLLNSDSFNLNGLVGDSHYSLCQFGFRIAPSGAGLVNNVQISNVHINGFYNYGFYLVNLDRSLNYENLIINPRYNSGKLFVCQNVTANQNVHNLVSDVPNSGNADPNNNLIIT